MSRRHGRSFGAASLWRAACELASKQEIPLRHGQLLGRLAGRQHRRRWSRGRSRSRPRSWAWRRCGSCSSWRCRRARSRPRPAPCRAPSRLASLPAANAWLTNVTAERGRRLAEGWRTSAGSAAAAASGSRRWDRPCAAAAIEPPLMTRSGFTPKNAGAPQHEIGELALLDRADVRATRRARSPD